jgi:hypothetical protein
VLYFYLYFPTLVVMRVLQGRPFIDCLMDTGRCERALKALMGGSKVEIP